MKKQERSYGPAPALSCICMLAATAGLAAFQVYYGKSALLAYLTWLCGYFALFLLVITAFGWLRGWLHTAHKKKTKKDVRSTGEKRVVPFAVLKKAGSWLAARKAKKSIDRLESQSDETPAPDTADEIALGSDQMQAETEMPAQMLSSAAESAETDAQPLQQPEGLSSLTATSPLAQADAGIQKSGSLQWLDLFYVLVQLGLTGGMFYRTVRFWFAGAAGELLRFDYVYVLLLLSLTVMCFVLRKFAVMQPDRPDTQTIVGVLQTLGAASGLLGGLAAAGMMLSFDGSFAAVTGVVVLAVYGMVMLLLGLINAAVRLHLTTDFNYRFWLPFAQIQQPGVSFFDALEANTGISLKSLWSVKYVFRIFPALILGFGGAMLLSTCLFKVEAYQQAALYRFGALKETAIYGAGLHVKLPWPIDQVELHDVTRSRQFTVGYDHGTTNNYLWTQSHGGEEYTLLLGDGNELVSLNMRVRYTIEDLYDYLTATAQPEQLLSAKGYEIMMHKTVKTNLDTLLNEGRQSIADDVAAELQAYSREAKLGICVEAVIVQNIHPPINVGSVYQDVVSADVRRQTLITNAETRSLQTVIQAEENASELLNTALTGQYNRTADATQEMAVYLAAFEAYDVSPECFMLTKYLDAYEKLIATRKLYVTGEGVDTSRFVLGAPGGAGSEPVVGWSAIEDLMDEQEAKKEEEEEFFYFGWSDDGL